MLWLRCLGSILLISGTCIGGGMLALPATLSSVGLLPSLCLMLIVWLLMFYSGLLVVEASITLDGETNFISMSDRALGISARIFTWIFYLLLTYSLVAAYFSGCSDLLSQYLPAKIVDAHHGLIPFMVSVSMGLLILLGIARIDIINRLLMIGLVISFFLLLYYLSPYVAIHNLDFSYNYTSLLSAVPVVITAFGYHVVVPSLCNYLNKSHKHLVWVIGIGSFIPLMIYSLWLFSVFGVFSSNEHKYLELIASSSSPVSSLASYLSLFTHNSKFLSLLFYSFSTYALLTSFIGISLSLFDFLMDGFKFPHDLKHKIVVVIASLLPPLLYYLFYPDGFVLALHYAGIFVVCLSGLLPAFIVWRLRTISLSKLYRVPGGNFTLYFIILVFILLLLAQFGVFQIVN